MSKGEDLGYHSSILCEEDAILLLADVDLMFNIRKPGRCESCNYIYTYTIEFIDHKKILKLLCTNYACSNPSTKIGNCPFFDFTNQLDKNACCMTTSQMLEVLFYWSHKMSIEEAKSLTGLSDKRIRAWYTHLTTVPMRLFEERSKLGGNLSVVHIEEILIPSYEDAINSKVKKKILADRETSFENRTEGPWMIIFFGKSNAKNEIRTFFIPSRREKELISLIKQEIKPDSIVRTSKCPAYDYLPEIFEQHKSVNLAQNYSPLKSYLTKSFIEKELKTILDLLIQKIVETREVNINYLSSIFIENWWRTINSDSSSSYMDIFLRDLSNIIKSNKLDSLIKLRSKTLKKSDSIPIQNSSKTLKKSDSIPIQSSADSRLSSETSRAENTISGYFKPDREKESPAMKLMREVEAIKREKQLAKNIPKKAAKEMIKNQATKSVPKIAEKDKGLLARIIHSLDDKKSSDKDLEMRRQIDEKKAKKKSAPQSDLKLIKSYDLNQEMDNEYQKILTEQYGIPNDNYASYKNAKFKTSISQFLEVPHVPQETMTIDLEPRKFLPPKDANIPKEKIIPVKKSDLPGRQTSNKEPVKVAVKTPPEKIKIDTNKIKVEEKPQKLERKTPEPVKTPRLPFQKQATTLVKQLIHPPKIPATSIKPRETKNPVSLSPKSPNPVSSSPKSPNPVSSSPKSPNPVPASAKSPKPVSTPPKLSYPISSSPKSPTSGPPSPKSPSPVPFLKSGAKTASQKNLSLTKETFRSEKTAPTKEGSKASDSAKYVCKLNHIHSLHSACGHRKNA